MPISTTSPAIQTTYTITTVVPVSAAGATNAVQAQIALDTAGADVDTVLRKLKLINNGEALYCKATATAVDVTVSTTINTTI